MAERIDTNADFMFELKAQLMDDVALLPVNKQFTMRLAKPDTCPSIRAGIRRGLMC